MLITLHARQVVLATSLLCKNVDSVINMIPPHAECSPGRRSRHARARGWHRSGSGEDGAVLMCSLQCSLLTFGIDDRVNEREYEGPSQFSYMSDQLELLRTNSA